MRKIFLLVVFIFSCINVPYSQDTIQSAFEDDGSLTIKEFHHIAKQQRKELVKSFHQQHHRMQKEG
ncbi:hypothetical protein IB655_02570 [Francisella noatunensis]|uniref:Uncharacterized protein n=1 Tax=Francisella noatunensis TaxID=657445 RepID=A0A9Q2KXU5_9GAMM|nr:hypothetical protein [Francisella noatunensis]MBK2028738.1 hypothetical protein [Francisella noatunensis]MBK2034526.1 hypothetical protein [Francisella noatunensis]MBK2048708.1 hypothetical protein [Francisella noatunensis]MBK2049910.1 hypothetical protein [Francisella noatunensis]MBK2051284.1 hypothetical protein [Francisella noatunensis]